MPRSKTVSIEDLQAELEEALKDAADAGVYASDEALKLAAKDTAQLVKANALRLFGGEGDKKSYANGWTYTKQKSKAHGYFGYVVYNKNKAGLAHLLENGHATKNPAKRAPAYPHIAEVEEKISGLVNSYLLRVSTGNIDADEGG